MKKLFILLFAFMVLGAVNAQDPQASQSVDQTIDYGTDRSYIYFYGQTGDTIGSGDSILTYTIRVKSKFALKPECYFATDSIGGTADSVLIGMYSKTFASEPWKLRESITWHGTADSNNVVMRSDSSHISEFWQFKMTGYSDDLKARLDTLIMKFTEDR